MRKFKTESKKLLDLMINSIYTNREIFLRELISNASDAVDKLYFRSLTDENVQLAKDDLSIRLAFDKDARTITVSDSGIGMTKDELDKNLGTIAHSGSLEFKTENAKGEGADEPAQAVDIIGQFGVGFYSSFMVAKRVRVVTKAFGSDEAWAWESDGIEGYTISEAEREGNGTDIVLYLKDDTDEENFDEFLSEWGLRKLVKKYSNYVRYPVTMACEKRRALPKPEDAGDDYQTEYETYTEIETLNSMIPIWKRKKSEVSDEEYNEFYKSNFHDFADPARVISVHAEGTLTYDALLFVPSRMPFDLYSRDFQRGLALYSSNVLIMDKCEELLPDHYGFIRGVVSSEDLTLNISRETLQHNRQLRAIAKKLEKKIKSELEDMRDTDRETYEQVFRGFGRSLKYGIYQSYGMEAANLADLLLFYSAREQKMVTLREYSQAMLADQTAIYYAAGESVDRLAKLPVVTGVLAKGFDVLLMTEDIDEFVLQSMPGYGEDEESRKPFMNVSGGDLGLLSEDEKAEAEQTAADNAEMLAALENALDGAVSKVSVSSRLEDAPACITAEGPISLEMEKLMSQMPAPDGQEAPKATRVLELNPKHAVFESLKSAFAAGDTDKLGVYATILYNQALLVEGLPIDDPIAYSNAVCSLM